MIVYIGDWVKITGEWRQVVDVGNDLFALIDFDGGLEWHDTRDCLLYTSPSPRDRG